METDLDLAPEQSRFATVEAYYKRNAARLLKALGGAEALAELRPSGSGTVVVVPE